ncbi:MAG: hypothetical protein O8C64_13045 [Candidatus Methanoperedens sp.]|nr:hypothetical protein [Candidatus Methanoperedens sp.]MCZ7403946.1 hypothetical protein [Candidatus Methanoperedens sp.]
MKKKMVLVIGILGILLVFGAAVALAQNTSEKTNDAGNHECTLEMMENMPEKCPSQMMQSGACENMMNGAKGCGELMGNEKPAGGNTYTQGGSHCGDMGSDMSSMMGSGSADMKRMM